MDMTNRLPRENLEKYWKTDYVAYIYAKEIF